LKRATAQQNAPVIDTISYAGYRFPLSLRVVEELLSAPGIERTYETVRRWSVKVGLGRRGSNTAVLALHGRAESVHGFGAGLAALTTDFEHGDKRARSDSLRLKRT